MEKVVLFFVKAQGEIASKLLHLRLRMRAFGPLAAAAIEDGDVVKALRRLSSADTTTAAGAAALSSSEMVALKPPDPPAHHHRMCVCTMLVVGRIDRPPDRVGSIQI